jgi:hypothetical protein
MRTKNMATRSLALAEERLAADKAKSINAKLDIEVRTGRLTVQQALTLGMVIANIQANPDGRFAEVLLGLIQGEF